MRFIISPAKKMRQEDHSFDYESLPVFLEKTQEILQKLREFSPEALQELWKCNDSLAALNEERVREMDLEKHLCPAILSYEGIQYQYMAPAVFEQSQFDYIQEHLRILSGFYGIVKPFDGVTPYRLEMQGKLSLGGKKNLYDFWGDTLGKTLSQETDMIINLASKEYSKAVLPHLTIPSITITFGEEVEGKVKEKATMCKMARGQMVRWAAENKLTTAESLKEFGEQDFAFRQELSQDDHFVFVKR